MSVNASHIGGSLFGWWTRERREMRRPAYRVDER
jgi:hypothetical protein